MTSSSEHTLWQPLQGTRGDGTNAHEEDTAFGVLRAELSDSSVQSCLARCAEKDDLDLPLRDCLKMNLVRVLKPEAHTAAAIKPAKARLNLHVYHPRSHVLNWQDETPNGDRTPTGYGRVP
ncbi:hypothetical protein N7535_005914 [Penicillium sp. DV-2018c]|nr:hypothetical protein N7535_005914 [Penicillium sp. DV-2018c]